MKLSGLIILASLFVSIILIASGTLISIQDFFEPKGHLFEGVVLFSIGVLLSSMVVIANSIGSAILLFKEIFANQLEMQKKMTDIYSAKSSAPRSIGDIFKDLAGDGSVTITNLNTGETSTTNFGENNGMSDLSKIILKNILDKKNSEESSSYSNMSREQLEAELAKAVSNDDYEKAMEIRQMITKLDNKEGE